MVNVRKCGVERILYVSGTDVKLWWLNKYRRVLKERAVLNVCHGFSIGKQQSASIFGIVILLKADNDMCDLTACGVVHWSVFDILDFWRGHSGM